MWRERNVTQAWFEPISGPGVRAGALPDFMLCPPLQSSCTSNYFSNDNGSLCSHFTALVQDYTRWRLFQVKDLTQPASPTVWDKYILWERSWWAYLEPGSRLAKRLSRECQSNSELWHSKSPGAAWNLRAACITYCTTDEAMWHLVCGPAAASGLQRLSGPTNEDREGGQRW